MHQKQMRLPFLDEPELKSSLPQENLDRIYATDGSTSITERVKLEEHYAHSLSPTSRFNRRLVSYQANKNKPLHRWIKYKEGFSAKLVEQLISEFSIKAGQHIFDPFAGSGTTLLVAQEQGIDATGIELLPMGYLAWQGKSQYAVYNLTELEHLLEWLKNTTPKLLNTRFPHIPITETAFPDETEQQFMWYWEQFKVITTDAAIQLLLQMTLMSILEDVSYTRKDGQYLRWDSRSEKAQRRDAKRIAQGKKPYQKFYKSAILSVQAALLESFKQIVEDVRVFQSQSVPPSQQQLFYDSVLMLLPTMKSGQFDAVITSPPYCNRYDYTRTYALELAFLGLSHDAVIQMRQDQLSCTVENRSKLQQLQEHYSAIGRSDDFKHVVAVLEQNKPLQEIFSALEQREKQGDLNNAGVVQMIRGYFTELAFTIYELYRVCKLGAQVAIVNDNVRYSGEIIPVDMLMLDLAVSFGFEPDKIYVLPQRKGNSSQQMGRFGREALRKSIIIWRKPDAESHENV
jgi:DNA modification methylase